jgi:RHS repeat-associated protein
MTDERGSTVWSATYYPFGEMTAGSNNTHGFTGKEYDSEMGLNYFCQRYYDPEIGRFTTLDPFAGYIELPQTQNRYAYCIGNPLKYIDPLGLIGEFEIGFEGGGGGGMPCIDGWYICLYPAYTGPSDPFDVEYGSDPRSKGYGGGTSGGQSAGGSGSGSGKSAGGGFAPPDVLSFNPPKITSPEIQIWPSLQHALESSTPFEFKCITEGERLSAYNDAYWFTVACGFIPGSTAIGVVCVLSGGDPYLTSAAMVTEALLLHRVAHAYGLKSIERLYWED